ncbi:hypothetical protein F2P79_012079 [Pimephales promelas]|nr:hypothetical protein F2P79_012079 [Pimephales promelas]
MSNIPYMARHTQMLSDIIKGVSDVSVNCFNWSFHDVEEEGWSSVRIKSLSFFFFLFTPASLQTHTTSLNLLISATDNMVFSAPLRILLLCLLHFSTRAVSEDVDPVILQRIITRFHQNLGLGQYTVVFRVDRNICLENSTFPDQNLLARVTNTVQSNGVYDEDNLVAAKAYPNQHSEYRLRNLLGNILNVPNQWGPLDPTM